MLRVHIETKDPEKLKLFNQGKLERPIWFSPVEPDADVKRRMKIYFTADAYMKAQILVMDQSGEIGWHMLVRPHKDGYQVYDVIVYPQEVRPAYIKVEMEENKPSGYHQWRINNPDEIEENMFGQGHSHVNFSTDHSSVDYSQQTNEMLTKRTGFYLFQIWNKKLDINSYFYDLDNGLLYLRNDIDLVIEFADGNSEEFVSDYKKYLYERFESPYSAYNNKDYYEPDDYDYATTYKKKHSDDSTSAILDEIENRYNKQLAKMLEYREYYDKFGNECVLATPGRIDTGDYDGDDFMEDLVRDLPNGDEMTEDYYNLIK